MKEVKHFIYTKANGDVSERAVWPINTPSNMLFGLDLSEFDQEDREQYVQSLIELEHDYMDAIYELGLGSQFRNFKEEGIEEI